MENFLATQTILFDNKFSHWEFFSGEVRRRAKEKNNIDDGTLTQKLLDWKRREENFIIIKSTHKKCRVTRRVR
jgi:hypothetical protein